jgi:Pyruvate/2-oxoglutarate dehydrogenase complex, dehydrogenase (E1) component, eukaryotic type, alpha subunit
MPLTVDEIQHELAFDPKRKKQLLKEIPQEKLVWMLRTMMLTRHFEENAEALYMRGLVHGTMHLSIGMEASPVGSIAALGPEDYIIHHHRGHGHTIAMGADINLMMGEFLGKEPGYNHGRGGSMHIADVEGRNLGATGIVGGNFTNAVGIGLALKMRKSKSLLMCFFGDGATNEGEFHEAFNMASIWKLPIVFICDNNQYGMSMAAEKVMPNRHIAERVLPYHIPAVTVDGNDVLAVYNAVSAAVDYVRAGNGPSMVENVTYRWRGHSKSDRNLYRTPEEMDEWKHFDPIVRYSQTLIEAKVMSSSDVESLDQQSSEAIEKAAETAIAYPEPSPENMENEVYAA